MISLILAILYSDLLQKHFLRGILVSSSCGSDKTLNSVLLLIGGLVTAVGGILMIIFTWFAPLLVGIVAGLLAIVWGALAAIAYWL
jgi:hypothetical protein